MEIKIDFSLPPDIGFGNFVIDEITDGYAEVKEAAPKPRYMVSSQCILTHIIYAAIS
jgi:hypothetical protein